MENPAHPGDFIRTEIIEPAGLTLTAAAIALGVSRPALSSLLNSRAALSGDMAPRIEKAFEVKMDTLMRMQSSYDIADASGLDFFVNKEGQSVRGRIVSGCLNPGTAQNNQLSVSLSDSA